MTTDKKEIIANIYLYLVTLIGLVMIVIPAVDLIKLGLQTWVFPLAAEDEYSYEKVPPEPWTMRDKMTTNTTAEDLGNIRLTESQQVDLQNWQTTYRTWEETQKNKDVAGIRLQRSLVRDISTLIVGAALFLTHGSIIRKRKQNT